MGLFRKAENVRLKKLRNDLNELCRIISDYEKDKQNESDKVLLTRFLEFERLFKKIEKDKKTAFRVDLNKEFYTKGISESNLRNFSVNFMLFLKCGENFHDFQSFQKSIGTEKLNVLYQMVASAKNLITQIDFIIEKREKAK